MHHTIGLRNNLAGFGQVVHAQVIGILIDIHALPGMVMSAALNSQ